MRSIIVVLASIVALGAAVAPSDGQQTFVCRRSILRSGPWKGAEMRIDAKHLLTCQQVIHSIAQGSFSQIKNTPDQLRFAAPGFRCRAVNLFYRATFVVGEQIACAASTRSFEFVWGPIAIPDG